MVIVHVGLASATSTPEMVIDEAEASLLASATADLLAQFDIAPDPKTRAIIGFIMACGTVYGPRAVMIKMRKAQEAEEKKAGPDGQGTAGVFDPAGFAAGTTNFSVHSAPPPNTTPPREEWPVKV